MGLLPCPECGHQISETAAVCPNCGFARPTPKPRTSFWRSRSFRSLFQAAILLTGYLGFMAENEAVGRSYIPLTMLLILVYYLLRRRRWF